MAAHLQPPYATRSTTGPVLQRRITVIGPRNPNSNLELVSQGADTATVTEASIATDASDSDDTGSISDRSMQGETTADH